VINAKARLFHPNERDPVPRYRGGAWAPRPAGAARKISTLPTSLGNATSNTEDETEKSKPEFWLLIKPMTICKLLSVLNKSTEIIKLHKILMWPVMRCGSATGHKHKLQNTTTCV
jgi:hypothetical protein